MMMMMMMMTVHRLDHQLLKHPKTDLPGHTRAEPPPPRPEDLFERTLPKANGGLAAISRHSPDKTNQ